MHESPLQGAHETAMVMLGLVLLYVGSLPVLTVTLPEVALNLLRTDSMHQLLVCVALLFSALTLLAGYLHTRSRAVLILSAAGAICLLASVSDPGNPCCSVLYGIAVEELTWSDVQPLEWLWFSLVPAGCTLLAAAHWGNRRIIRRSA
jgi:hypothetical protein